MSERSDNTAPTDSAIEVLRERERQLNVEAQMISARLTEVRELIDLLDRSRPRAPRKPRAVPATGGTADAATSPPASTFSFAPPAEEVVA